MSDISSWWKVDKNRADWLIGSGDLLSGNDLQSAIIMSLFTDRLAREDDELDDEYRRGWWGDTDADYMIGSRLWLLERQKLTLEVARKAEGYAQEALKWLKDDGVVLEIEVATQIVYPNRLNMVVRFHQPGDERNLRFFWVWEG